jgi:hypothetical protein
MKVFSSFGRKDSPALVTTTDNVKCHYCCCDEDDRSPNIKKGTQCIKFIFNAGPTGSAYVCMKNAKQICDELMKLV